eukprot:3194620-Prymnesium_polylepis.1
MATFLLEHGAHLVHIRDGHETRRSGRERRQRRCPRWCWRRRRLASKNARNRHDAINGARLLAQLTDRADCGVGRTEEACQRRQCLRRHHTEDLGRADKRSVAQ